MYGNVLGGELSRKWLLLSQEKLAFCLIVLRNEY